MTSSQCFFNKMSLMNDNQLSLFLTPSKGGTSGDNANEYMLGGVKRPSCDISPEPEIEQDRSYCLNQFVGALDANGGQLPFYYPTDPSPPHPKILKIEGNRVITTRNVIPVALSSNLFLETTTPYQQFQLPSPLTKRNEDLRQSPMGTIIRSSEKVRGGYMTPSKAPPPSLSSHHSGKRYNIQFIREQPLDDDLLDVIGSADLGPTTSSPDHSRTPDVISTTVDGLSGVDTVHDMQEMVVASCEDIITSSDDLSSTHALNPGSLSCNQNGTMVDLSHDTDQSHGLNDSMISVTDSACHDAELYFHDVVTGQSTICHQSDPNDPFVNL
jgi:hypothetical protein